jgi:hypothetical protein
MMLVAKLGLQLALMRFRGLAVPYRLPNFKPLVMPSDLVHAFKHGTASQTMCEA